MTDQSSQDKKLRSNSAKQTERANNKQEMTEADLIRTVVEPGIFEAGWHNNGVLREQRVSLQGLRLSFDFVLIHEWYPLAVVEVKRPERFNGSGALQQAKYYAETIGLPLAIATDGTNCVSLNLENEQTQSWEKFPSPQDLWQWLDRPVNSDDPRLSPAPGSSPPRLHQALAIGRVLDALVSGQKRGIISMAQGSGVTIVIAQLMHKLIQSGFCKHILYISDRIEELNVVYEELNVLYSSLNKEHLVSFIESNKPLDANAKIHIVTTKYLIKNKDFFEEDQAETGFYDLIITRNINFIDKLLDGSNALSSATILGFSNTEIAPTKNFANKPIFEYFIEDAVADISPPKGFKTVLMGDIAQISLGLTPSRIQYEIVEEEGALKSRQTYLLSGNNILEDEGINIDKIRKIQPQQLSEDSGKKDYEKYLIQAGDILIPSIARHFNKKVAVFSEALQGDVVFGNSVIRVRVDPAKANPSDVVSFLRSDSGQIIIQRFASSLAGMPRLTPSALAQTPIFISEEANSTPKVEALSNIAMAIQQLKKDILPSLELLNAPSNSSGEEDNKLAVVALQLRHILDNLVRQPLPERVLSNYPTPIAVAYKRFQDSRFNVYEQVQRLRDVYESVSFFVYNLVLADWFQRLEPTNCFIADSGARRAFNGYSMSRRTDFVSEIINIARSNNGIELFVPELINSPFVQCAKNLQELRNNLSHTATATESRQRRLLEESLPHIEELLSGLDFLEDYRVVRVPSFYKRNGKLTCRIEVYQGTVPVLDEKTASEDFSLDDLLQAECDHLVMLNSSGQILDLHPLYQLVEDESTQFEPHICFFKQRKQQEKILEGESVQNSKIIYLKGFDEFESLQNKILEKPSITE